MRQGCAYDTGGGHQIREHASPTPAPMLKSLMASRRGVTPITILLPFLYPMEAWRYGVGFVFSGSHGVRVWRE